MSFNTNRRKQLWIKSYLCLSETKSGYNSSLQILHFIKWCSWFKKIQVNNRNQMNSNKRLESLFFWKMTRTFFLDVVWTREFLLWKVPCFGYTHNFFHWHSLCRKNLQRNEVEVRLLFYQTVELKLIKIKGYFIP